MSFSVAKFCSSCVALFIKLPLETVLRRGQISVLATQSYVRAISARDQKLDTIVPIGLYKGVFGTMYHIVNEEGSHAINTKLTPGKMTKSAKGKAKVAESVYRKGQGLEGLWRGFGVSWWGLVGLWSVGILSNAGDGEF
jgi:mitochondrial fusion and transport protein UGO1